jgi:Zn-dependent protease
MILDFLSWTRDSFLSVFGLQDYSHLFIFELIDMVIMSLAIGYIFSDLLRKPAPENYDPLVHYKKRSFAWENIKFAALAAGPAVVLHELAHKFVAMSFGAQAVLYAPYGFYLLVVILKAIGFPLLFFVGGFVAHTPLPYLPSALVALAGPLTNFIIWLAITIALKRNLIQKKYRLFLIPLAQISIFLAIFNMLPLPGLDGWGFFTDLIKAFS